jgi:serine/threonine protein kinase
MYCQAAFLLSRLCRQQDPSQLPNLLLADFGVAKMATTSKLSGTVRGTLEDMAPEQLAGMPVAASDQYALGIMVYELLTGHTPFHGTFPQAIPYIHANVDPKPPSEVNPSLSSTLDAIILRALAKKPQDRFASVKEFASAFADALKPNAAQLSGAKKTLERTTQERLPEYAPWINPLAAKKVSNRPTVPDTKQPPRKYSFLWALAIGGVLTRGSLGFASFYLPYPPYGLFEIYEISLPLLILWITGLVTGKITRQGRMGWISGITPVVLIAPFALISWFPVTLSEVIQLVFIGAPICGLISFGGASFATRKSRK